MSKENFIENKKALIVLIAASVVVLISMGIRQCWGLFYQYFETDLGFSRTQFGLAIAIQMLFWGAFAPVFGFLLISMEEQKPYLSLSSFTLLEFIWFILNQSQFFLFS